MKRDAGPKRLAGLQAAYCPVRELGPNYFSVYASQTPGKRELRGVLEVSGMNHLLKSEEEKRLVSDVFQTVLASLTYPIQVLLRVLPFDLERYLQGQEPDGRAQGGAWQHLSANYVHFLRDLSKQLTLLDRRFYVIVPALDAPMEDSASSSLFSRLLFSGRMRSTRQTAFEQGRPLLDGRCEELTRQLSKMGLSVRRLERQELAQLEYSCYSPQRAQMYPLQTSWLEGLDRLAIRAEGPLPTVQLRRVGSLVIEQTTLSRESEPHGGREKKGKKATRKTKEGASEGLFRWPDFADMISPAGIHLTPDSLCVDNVEYVQVLDVHMLPRQVTAGWFSQLAMIKEPMEVSLFYSPLPTAKTLQHLARKRFEASSSNTLNQEVDRYNPEVRFAQNDLEDLMDRIASGEDRMLSFSMHALVRGATKRELHERASRIRAVLHSMMLGVRPALFEMDKGFLSCLPQCRDVLQTSKYPLALASREAATTFPFLSSTLLHHQGILEGITFTGEPVILDWWAKELRNANRLIVGPSGSGKSFKAKLDIMRSFLLYYARAPREGREPHGKTTLPFQILVVDIEREFLRETKALGGQWIRFAPGSQHRINPFDLPQRASSFQSLGEDTLGEKVAKIQALLSVMLAEPDSAGVRRLTQAEKGLLDRAIYALYVQAGITKDPSTHTRTPPLLRDLYRILEAGTSGHDSTGLALRLRRYVTGSLAGTFSGQTNVTLDAPMISFDTRDLPEELRPVVLFLISEHVWNVSFGSTIPRMLVVDELLSLYEYEQGRWFLEALFQRARKHYLSVVGITQYPKILLESTIPTNCATTILMAQEAASIPLVQEVFQLSEPEVHLVRSFGKGEGLFLCGTNRVALRFVASPLEYDCCTSDSEDLARLEQHPEEEQKGSLEQKPVGERESSSATDHFLPVSGRSLPSRHREGGGA